MLNTTMQSLGAAPSAIRTLFAYGAERKKVIGADKVFDYSIGNPSVPAPQEVGNAMVEFGQADPVAVHAYTQAAGDPDIRQHIADSLNRQHGTSYDASNLYLTCGAAAAISISLKAIIEPGDEIIVISPYFPEYRVWIETHGARIVEVPARLDNFEIDLPALEAAITAHTKAVIINTPNNPVGVVYSLENLQGLASVLTRKSEQNGRPIFLISDEPYRELVYGGREVPWVPSIYDNTIVCYSWSKCLSLPGERIGYVLVPPTATEHVALTQAVSGAGRALGFICAPALFQRIIERCVDLPADIATYERNRQILCDILDEFGYTYIEPQGAFYLWVKALEDDAQAFSDKAKEHELLLVPSDSFGVGGWVRLGYCIAEETIRNSREAFGALKRDYE
ncbi:pyridoxal phosphate-dependent aminotransferase [Denitrobacterium detoxificans]|jgi:aspartate aminotransferase|uniref:pyridoxal phosphate-dependent aminotransferase n=1 Tax=Denitrobacterium detoxificans TaxID=79604 RepID=UPI0026F0BF10|nr:pyridoxal phosphate-dependent aminotransferase [Denitrobacterium detoxificans]MBE6466285.1 pyridoxal phosphate-dependent aminotransferase [Denitrobacterium detoxificans]